MVSELILYFMSSDLKPYKHFFNSWYQKEKTGPIKFIDCILYLVMNVTHFT
jgi:hypothetical protein